VFAAELTGSATEQRVAYHASWTSSPPSVVYTAFVNGLASSARIIGIEIHCKPATEHRSTPKKNRNAGGHASPHASSTRDEG
jgi:hypothetical protein